MLAWFGTPSNDGVRLGGEARRRFSRRARRLFVCAPIIALGLSSWDARAEDRFAQVQSPAPVEKDQTVPGTGSPRGQENLTDKLNRTDGVIRPPTGVDPEIHVPAPNPNSGTMIIIPPPGTDNTAPVRPKS